MSDNNRSNILNQQQTINNTIQKFMKNYQVDPIKNLLTTASTAQVIIPTTNIDSVAAGLSLALGLKKAGKTVTVFTPQATDNNYSKLSGLDLLTNQISANDLTITVDHPLDQIEKVSYNDDGGKLNLVVQTKPGSTQIQNEKINIQNGGSNADISFILGDEATLGQNADIVNRGNWVIISNTQVNKSWAKATIIDPSAPFCEIFTFLLPLLGIKLDMDSGKNLLIGLRVATQSFSVNVSPESFEAGAICLKATQPVPGQPDPLASTPIAGVENKSGTPGMNKANPVGTV